jgi:FkbM family methyltransferase
MFDLAQLQATHHLYPRGVIHVGAHYGQEAALYDNAFRAERVLWVEADPETHLLLQSSLANRPTHIALQGMIADVDDQARTFYRTLNEGMSSSYLPLKEHLNIYPGITVTGTIRLSTVTLPSLLARHEIEPTLFDYLVIDTQGTELQVLLGCGDSLANFRWICCEVNQIELYQGCAMFADITRFLRASGFVLVDSAWTDYGWGDALYVRPPS